MLKTRRGGKYANNLYASGYFGRNDAGQAREPGGGGKPVKREFIGSGLKEYVFADDKHGTRSIIAHTYKEALQIAETLGFTSSDYKKKRKLN